MDCIHSGHISPPSPRTPSASQSYSIIETAKANGLNPVALFFFLGFALEEHGVAEGENSTFLLASPIPAIL